MILATNALHLEISRFIIGIAGGGAQTAISIYVAEIADTKYYYIIN